MSSFYGGPQLQDVSTITDTANGTKYTVPAGRYAVIELMDLSDQDSVTIGGSSFTLKGGFRLDSGIVVAGDIASDTSQYAIKDFTLVAGETVVLSGSPTKFRINIYEYLAP